MKRVTKILLMLTLCGCQETHVSRFRAEWPQTVQRARSRVLAELPNLDDDSREMVRTNEPRLEVVRILYPMSDYRFIWTISSNRLVELDADDYKHLENSSVRIREQQLEDADE